MALTEARVDIFLTTIFRFGELVLFDDFANGRLWDWLAMSVIILCSFAQLGSGSSCFAEPMADWLR